MPALSTKAECSHGGVDGVGGGADIGVAAGRRWIRALSDFAVGVQPGEVDLGAESLVDAMLGPGLGQRFQLDIGGRDAPCLA